jgi:hypothetical protein
VHLIMAKAETCSALQKIEEREWTLAKVARRQQKWNKKSSKNKQNEDKPHLVERICITLRTRADSHFAFPLLSYGWPFPPAIRRNSCSVLYHKHFYGSPKEYKNSSAAP